MLSNDQLGVKLNHSAMFAQCPHCPKADVDPRIVMSQKCHSPTYAVQQIAMLFDCLVSDGQQAGRHSRLQIDDEFALVD
jgi:hypothetical protein